MAGFRVDAGCDESADDVLVSAGVDADDLGGVGGRFGADHDDQVSGGDDLDELAAEPDGGVAGARRRWW